MSNDSNEEKEYDIIEIQSSSLRDVVDRQSVTIMNNSITIKNFSEVLIGELIPYVFLKKKNTIYFDSFGYVDTVMILLGALILYVLILIMLGKIPLHHTVTAPSPSPRSFESLSDSLSSLNSSSSSYSSSSSSSKNTFYTSDGVRLSAKTNWIAPVGAYKDCCYLCNYFGHGMNVCPNIRSEYLGKCCKCWSNNHESKECKREPVSIPFKENYLKPAELLKKFGLFEE